MSYVSDNTVATFLAILSPLSLSLFITDACYVLSFSVIMLNTSLHNPNVKDKVSHVTGGPVTVM